MRLASDERQKNGSLNETDMLELARLLFKAGYMVVQRKEQINKKNVRVIEFDMVDTKTEN